MNFLNIFTTSILSFLLKSTVEKYLFISQDKNNFTHQQFVAKFIIRNNYAINLNIIYDL